MKKKQLWKKLEEPFYPDHIKEDDFCIYAREYIGGRRGYSAGETNSLILNFKKSPNKMYTNEWNHRKRAVEKFKTEIEFLVKQNVPWTMTAIPSSKQKNDPEYNNRFEDLFSKLKISRPKINIEWPVEIKTTAAASHHRGEDRDPVIIQNNYFWKGFSKKAPKVLIIVDDILTTGSHFRAMSDFLRKNGYEGKIVGVFWAKTKAIT